MKTFLVGGAVRDTLMGIEPKDRDYVVIGATPQDMLDLGFKQVGADFPVFLHPVTGEEYALARIERKIAKGYQGFATDFSPDIKLADDLKRRDLTMNSMAMDTTTGEVFDFFGGEQDIENRIIRHTSEAFKEDPVRILRVARFAARYGFDVAEETMNLMREMVDNGEFDSLVPERVWAEFAKGLMEQHPQRMLFVLDLCGALKKLPFYDSIRKDVVWRSLQDRESDGMAVLGATLFRHRTKKEFHDNRIPTEVSELAMLVDRIENFVKSYTQMTTDEEWVKMFVECDAYRRQERFVNAFKVLQMRGTHREMQLIVFFKMVRSTVNEASIALACEDKSKIKEKIHQARLDALKP